MEGMVKFKVTTKDEDDCYNEALFLGSNILVVVKYLERTGRINIDTITKIEVVE